MPFNCDCKYFCILIEHRSVSIIGETHVSQTLQTLQSRNRCDAAAAAADAADASHTDESMSVFHTKTAGYKK